MSFANMNQESGACYNVLLAYWFNALACKKSNTQTPSRFFCNSNLLKVIRTARVLDTVIVHLKQEINVWHHDKMRCSAVQVYFTKT